MTRIANVEVFKYSELDESTQYQVLEDKRERENLFSDADALEILDRYCDQLRLVGIDIKKGSVEYKKGLNKIPSKFLGQITRVSLSDDEIEFADWLPESDREWMLDIKAGIESWFDGDFDIKVYDGVREWSGSSYRELFRNMNNDSGNVIDIRYETDGRHIVKLTPRDALSLLGDSFANDHPEDTKYGNLLNEVRRISINLNIVVYQYCRKIESRENWEKEFIEGKFSNLEFLKYGEVFDFEHKPSNKE